MSFNDAAHRYVQLFHDDRDNPWFLRNVSLHRVSANLLVTHDVLSMDGLASSCTRVGVPSQSTYLNCQAGSV